MLLVDGCYVINMFTALHHTTPQSWDFFGPCPVHTVLFAQYGVWFGVMNDERVVESLVYRTTANIFNYTGKWIDFHSAFFKIIVPQRKGMKIFRKKGWTTVYATIGCIICKSQWSKGPGTTTASAKCLVVFAFFMRHNVPTSMKIACFIPSSGKSTVKKEMQLHYGRPSVLRAIPRLQR